MVHDFDPDQGHYATCDDCDESYGYTPKDRQTSLRGADEARDGHDAYGMPLPPARRSWKLVACLLAMAVIVLSVIAMKG